MSSQPSPSQSPAVDLNLASAAELRVALAGVGPVLAGRIVAHRENHGPFRGAAELARVPGISRRMAERLLGSATVPHPIDQPSVPPVPTTDVAPELPEGDTLYALPMEVAPPWVAPEPLGAAANDADEPCAASALVTVAPPPYAAALCPAMPVATPVVAEDAPAPTVLAAAPATPSAMQEPPPVRAPAPASGAVRPRPRQPGRPGWSGIAVVAAVVGLILLWGPEASSTVAEVAPSLAARLGQIEAELLRSRQASSEASRAATDVGARADRLDEAVARLESAGTRLAELETALRKLDHDVVGVRERVRHTGVELAARVGRLEGAGDGDAVYSDARTAVAEVAARPSTPKLRAPVDRIGRGKR